AQRTEKRLMLYESRDRISATRKAALIFTRRHLFAVRAALAIVRKEKTGHVGIGIGVAWPASDQILRRRRPPVVPAGAKLVYQLTLQTPHHGKIAPRCRRRVGLVAANRLVRPFLHHGR